jgi:outer membrane protein assembly factor BamB
MLILICDQDTDSYLLALDKATGQVRYKVPRPEVTRGYSVPAVYRPAKGPAELIVPGAYYIMGYDLATGEKLWWARGMAWQVKGVPVMMDDVIYMNGWDVGGDAPSETMPWEEALAKHDANKDGLISPQEIWSVFRNFGEYELDRDGLMNEREWNFYRARTGAANNLMAVRAGGRGDVTDSRVLWRFTKSLPYVPSPLLYENVLYLVKDGGVVTTLNPKNGAILQQGRLPKAIERYWSSPVAGDGKVYMLSEMCKLTVLRAGEKLAILATNDLDDYCFATPAIADSRIYLRTRSALYCFGSKKD